MTSMREPAPTLAPVGQQAVQVAMSTESTTVASTPSTHRDATAMHITYLGHAGFCVETSQVILIMDPWLSPTGAFDSAWFQLPRNHHMAAFVQEKLRDARKARYLYISHEHKDHFDVEFLESIRCRDFMLIIPHYRRDALRRLLSTYNCREIIACADGQAVDIPGGYLRLYLDDSELNRDSAILVKANGHSFLNLNDCKVYDRIPAITEAEGPIETFACQYSGATWHPTCYDYPREAYERISKKKRISKFEAVARALNLLQPRIYLPSAGPACFLDPQLLEINFEEMNIFPRLAHLRAYLEKRLRHSSTEIADLMPGDVLDVATAQVTPSGAERLTEETFEAYVRSYAALYAGYFADRQRQYLAANSDDILFRLCEVFKAKLEHLTLHDRVTVPLYFRLSDLENVMLRVNFPAKRVERTTAIAEENYYVVSAPSWEVTRVLDGRLTWEDFSLTFRMRLNRQPDIYQTVIQGFLTMEPEDVNWFCAKLLTVEENQERMVVEAGGKRYAINRFCPHQGGDLTEAWIEQGRFVTCPRHRWQFDLERGGLCLTSNDGIRAVCLEED